MILKFYFKTKSGEWSLPDEEVKCLFDRMEAEGKTRFAFPCKDDPKSAEEFMETMRNGLNNLFVVDVNGSTCGFIWLNKFEHKMARIHFCSFDGLSLSDKISATSEATDEILSMKDGKGFLFDSLAGFIAQSNKPAQMLVKAAGFRFCGVIPNAVWVEDDNTSEPAVILCKTRA